MAPPNTLPNGQTAQSNRFSQIVSQPSLATAETVQCPVIPSVHVRIVPNIDDPSRCLIFDIVDREFEPGESIKIGRFTDRHTLTHMSFKSKVVSRAHCEIWAETDGKLYIKDTRSSSGTFLNHIRLSSANHESRPTQIQDGDIVQLGIDYQGGQEEIYRSVRMRFELNRSRNPRPMSYTIAAFNNLRQFTNPQKPQKLDTKTNSTKHHSHLIKSCVSPDSSAGLQQKSKPADESIEECCICLYAMAPFQALFVSPCAHSYHYKCIRPLLKSHPGFQCPICRTYSDLEQSVAIEEDLVAKNDVHPTVQDPDQSDSIQQPQPVIPVLASDIEIARDRRTVFIEETTEPITSQPTIHTEPVIQEDSAENEQSSSRRDTDRRLSATSLMEKIKMVFFDKRKSVAVEQPIQRTQPRRKRPNKRPLSYPNFWRRSTTEEDLMDFWPTNPQQSLSNPCSSRPSRPCITIQSSQSTRESEQGSYSLSNSS
ncbi:hypothetical protein CLU79DRAFT_766890 [Phycomyces nitens]|nr:hypothetical protein CLU79DRAFT_766890 [Phycomyces nitens]